MFERQDWTLFRTVEGLQQKAGVPAKLLRRLVLKELGDNALDTGAVIKFGQIGSSPDKFYVEDAGPGLDGTPDRIAELFSIRRPMRSSKLLRVPQCGALGNGLRVVAGAVLASEGSLAVISRNRRIVLQPRADGHTAVVELTAVDYPIGTRIEISFGPALPRDGNALVWIRRANAAAIAGESFEGRSSPFWYDAAQFHELLLACGAQPVRSLIAQLDGCSGGKAGYIVAAAGLERMACAEINRQQAVRLLKAARKQARPVSPERLGGIGRDGFPDDDLFYAAERGAVELGTVEPLAEILFVAEAWAQKLQSTGRLKDELKAILLINRSPAVDELAVWRDGDKDLNLNGSGLEHYGSNAPKTGAYLIVVNVTTPYCPITSDGKAPDLSVFAGRILVAVEDAMRKAQRAAPKDKKVSQKDVVLDNLDDAIAKASGDGEYRFNERQLFYKLRPIVQQKTDQELRIGNFKAILTDHEKENGEIPGMYREPRGSIYHPHRDDDIPLGTLTVEEYERPVWTFNKLVYIEKEGFSEALKEWPERHDCALLSSKGFTTRAARDLVDKLAEHDEPVTVFCVTDADAFGTVIYETFQQATKARRARKIGIVHLGLHPWEAVDAGLEVEEVERGDQRKPVAAYVLEREDGDEWERWLQTHRVELNAMTTPEFIAWLDGEMAEHGGKLIPPDDVIVAELEERLESKVRAAVTERILREAGLEDQIAAVLKAIERPNAADLKNRIRQLFENNPEREWRDPIDEAADDLSAGARHDPARSTSFDFEAMNLRFTASVSRYPDGRISELFLDNHEAGSAIGAPARDAAIVFSFAVQHGADSGSDPQGVVPRCSRQCQRAARRSARCDFKNGETIMRSDIEGQETTATRATPISIC